MHHKEVEAVLCTIADRDSAINDFAHFLGVRDPRESVLDASIAAAQEQLAGLKARLEQLTEAHALTVDDYRHEIIMLSYTEPDFEGMRVSDFAFRLINAPQ